MECVVRENVALKHKRLDDDKNTITSIGMGIDNFAKQNSHEISRIPILNFNNHLNSGGR